MLKFTEFLSEERKIDSAELANRAGRRYGTKEKYGKWFKAEKGEHIPLKSYNHNKTESVLAKSDKVRQKIGGPDYYHPDKKKGDAAKKKYEDAHKEKEFHIKDLKATQPFVKISDKEKLHDKIHHEKDSHPIVATHQGHHYVLDGHHRVLGASLRGEKTIKVKHINLDEYK